MAPKKLAVMKFPMRFAGIAPSPAMNPNPISAVEQPVLSAAHTSPNKLTATDLRNELFFIFNLQKKASHSSCGEAARRRSPSNTNSFYFKLCSVRDVLPRPATTAKSSSQPLASGVRYNGHVMSQEVFFFISIGTMVVFRSSESWIESHSL